MYPGSIGDRHFSNNHPVTTASVARSWRGHCCGAQREPVRLDRTASEPAEYNVRLSTLTRSVYALGELLDEPG